MSNIRIPDVIENANRGDILKYFDEEQKIISANDGVHDCRMITTNAYQNQVPFNHSAHSKIKITDPSFHITNIDKSYLSATIRLTLQLTTSDTITPTTNVEESSKACKIFVGLKDSTQWLDSRKINWSNGATYYENTKMIYETTVAGNCRTEQEKLTRPSVYSTWEAAWTHSNNVCGCFVSVDDLIRNTSITADMKLIIPLDNFLALQSCTAYPNAIFDEFELDIKQRIAQNFVFCQVDPSVLVEEYNENHVAGSQITFNTAFRRKLTKEFTQCGDDAMLLCWNTVSSASTFSQFTGTINVTESTCTLFQSVIHGFNVKDTVLKELSNRYSQKPLYIPAQITTEYDFPPNQTTARINCSNMMSYLNTSMLFFLFPRSNHQCTVSKNPHIGDIKVITNNKTIPDQQMDTVCSEFTEFQVANVNFDTLFASPKSFVNSLTFNEYDETLTNRRKVFLEDATDFMLSIPLERYSSGCMFDGVYSTSNMSLTLQATPLYGDYNPYIKPNGTTGAVNTNAINIVLLNDAMWSLTPNKVELLTNVDLDAMFK